MSTNLAPLLFACGSGLAIAVLGLAYKVSAQRQCRPVPFTVAFLLTAGVLLLVKSFTEPTAWGDPRLWALALPMGFLFYVGIPTIIAANRMGPASVNWTFVNLGLIVPILAGPFFFHETPLLVDGVTIVLFVVMLLTFARDMATGDETKAEHLLVYSLLLLAVWANNGIAMSLLKAKDVVLGQVSSGAFGAIFYLFGGVLMLLTMPFTERGQRASAGDYGVGALAGLCSGAAILFMLLAAGLPTAVLFPVTQGLGLLGGVVLAAVIYKERLTPLKLTGLALGMAVLLCAGLRTAITATFYAIGGR